MHSWNRSALEAAYPAESVSERPLTVVFTTERATLAALEYVTKLAGDLQTRVRILVPQVVPYPLPIDHPPAAAAFRLKTLLALARNGTIEIDVRLCRDASECVTQV